MTAATERATPAQDGGLDAIATWLVRRTRAVVWLGILFLAAWQAYVAWQVVVTHRAGFIGATWRPPATEAQVLGRGRHPDAGRIVAVQPGSPAMAAGLRAGDELVAVDGIPVGDAQAIAARVRTLATGDVVRLTVRPREPAGADPRDADVTIGSPYASRRHQALLAARWAMAFGVFFGTGLFVAWKRPGDARALLFFVFSTLLAGALAATPLLESRLMPAPGFEPVLAPRPSIPWGPLAGMTLAAFAAAPVLLHFALLFPRPALARPALDRLVGVSYATLPMGLAGAVPLLALLALAAVVPRTLRVPALALLAAMAAASAALLARRVVGAARLAGDWRVALDRLPAVAAVLVVAFTSLTAVLTAALAALDVPREVAGLAVGISALAPALLTFVVGVVVFPIGTCVVLWRNYRDGTPEERRQIKWPVWGTLIANLGALVASALTVAGAMRAPAQSGGPAVAVAEFLTWAVYGLIPLSFAFAILRYRLLDIDVIIRRTVVYGVVSAGVLLVYLGAVIVVSRLVVTWFGEGDTLAVILSTLAAAAAFVPLRASVQRWVDARFFRTRSATARALARLGRGLADAESVAALGARVAQEVVAAIPMRTAAVLAVVDGERTLKVAAAHGVSDPVREAVERCDAQALLARLAAEPSAPAALDLVAEWRAALDMMRARRLVALREGDQVRGVLVLGPKLSDEEYDEDDRELLAAMASQAALAWRGVRARGQDAELREALDIQRSLLPASLPPTPGYTIAGAWQPAKVVGGDYYDAWLVGPGRCALCIADVSGKGLPASLLMANLQASMRAHARQAAGADAICTAVNRAVSAHIRPGRFITCFFGLLDLETGALDYVNAGHNPPLLARADGAIERLSTGGIGLGMLAGFEYGAKATTLAPGDRLLLYTDGVTDARDEHGEDFGDQRLAGILGAARAEPAAGLQQRVIDAVRAFSGSRFDDDVTVLAVVRDAT